MNGGWSLAELLVAMAVGALIALFAGSLLAGANAGLITQAEDAALNDTGRYVLATVGKAIRQAGWQTRDHSMPAVSAVETPICQLKIVFAGAADGSMLNCAGSPETGFTGISIFELDGDVLRCRYQNASSWSAQPMATGVRDFSMSFALDVDEPRDGVGNRWVAAAEVVEWKRVVSVRLRFSLKGKASQPAFEMTYPVRNLP